MDAIVNRVALGSIGEPGEYRELILSTRVLSGDSG
jgi:hypothetical protein